jgi:hypothetical protein
VVFVCGQLGNADADFLLPLVAIFGELGKKGAGIRTGTKQPFLHGKAGRLFVFSDKLIVCREDIGSIAGNDLVDPHRYLVAERDAFQPLIPFFRLYLTLGINLGGLSVGGDPDVDRGDALGVTLVFLQKKTTLKVFLSMTARL